MNDKALNIDKKDIEQYLSEVKEAVQSDRYRLTRNTKRQDNIYCTPVEFAVQPDCRPPARYFP